MCVLGMECVFLCVREIVTIRLSFYTHHCLNNDREVLGVMVDEGDIATSTHEMTST